VKIDEALSFAMLRTSQKKVVFNPTIYFLTSGVWAQHEILYSPALQPFFIHSFEEVFHTTEARFNGKLATPACKEVRCSLYAKGVEFKRAEKDSVGCRTQMKYAAIYKGEGGLKKTELRNFRQSMATFRESWKDVTTSGICHRVH
jgi:hypothetical protein